MNDRKKHIAFIYEGVKTEKALMEKLQSVYFDRIADTVILSLAAAQNIYMLWNELRKDDFETEVIDVLKILDPEIGKQLGELTSRDFSEIYLFFDYDGHNDNLPKEYRDVDVVQQMLETFDNETEFGKLYISYPMIESLREIVLKEEEYATFFVSVDEFIQYKRDVSERLEFQNFHKIDEERWEVACRASVKRANLIVTYRNEIPSYEHFLNKLGQRGIYAAQMEHFIQAGKMVSVLNSVPLFLLEYFDQTFWRCVMKR